MKSLSDTYTLSNDLPIPCIGFGTAGGEPGSGVPESAILAAIELGYRHIDTAQSYGNEDSVGRAVRHCGLAREDIFVTSKLVGHEHGYEKTHAAFAGTMERMGLDYLDLFLIHWPNPIAYRDRWQAVNAETWKAFEELYAAGRIRAIGVSNFRPHHLDALLKSANVAPMVNQIRLCPGDTQDDVVDYCRARGILLSAYSPLGAGGIFAVPEMQALAQKYEKSIAQICIRWSLQQGFLPLPKSATPERIKANADVFDFALEASDVELIAGLKGCVGYSMDPDEATW